VNNIVFFHLLAFSYTLVFFF